MDRGEIIDAVKGFLEGDDPTATPVLDLPGLRCLTASPETLLALKVLAHRVGEDEADLRLLACAPVPEERYKLLGSLTPQRGSVLLTASHFRHISRLGPRNSHGEHREFTTGIEPCVRVPGK
jgi:hypothetical protein